MPAARIPARAVPIVLRSRPPAGQCLFAGCTERSLRNRIGVPTGRCQEHRSEDVGRGHKVVDLEERSWRDRFPQARESKCKVAGCGNEAIKDKAGRSRGRCADHPLSLDRSVGAQGKTWLDDRRWLDKAGYVMTASDDGGTVAEHRVVMGHLLGRPLLSGETVRHRNGLRHDNRPENLELWVGGVRYGQRAADLTCAGCGMTWLASAAISVRAHKAA